MSREFIRSTLLKTHTAATETIERDLPVNPISHLIITLSGFNVTDEATLAEILAFINTVEVTHAGKTIVNLESEDLYALNLRLFGHYPTLTGKLAADNEVRALSLIVPFGRTLFNPLECYQATRKGELTLRVNTTVPATSLDNGIINIDTVELIGATPERHLKSTLMTIAAPGATGDNDVLLPIGNDLVMLQIRMTSIPAAAGETYGVSSARVLVDNREYGYCSAQTQCLQADKVLFASGQHGTIAAQGLEAAENVVWLDFDPLGDGAFLLETAGHSEVKLRLTMGVNEATKLSVVELVKSAP